jgi:glutaredoxin-related protein
MKKIILFITLFICAVSSKAQTVNDLPIKDIDVEYVQIVGTSKLFSRNLLSKLTLDKEQNSFHQVKKQL